MAYPITERFLRTNWQRARLEEHVFDRLVRRPPAKRSDVVQIVQKSLARDGVVLTASQRKAVERSIKSIIASRPLERPVLLRKIAWRISDRTIKRASHDPKKSSAAAEKIVDRSIIQPHFLGTTVIVPEDEWRKAGMADFDGVQVGNLSLLAGDADIRKTVRHERFHTWQSATSPEDNTLRSEVSAYYLEGWTPSRIARCVLDVSYPDAHVLSGLHYLWRERADAEKRLAAAKKGLASRVDIEFHRRKVKAARSALERRRKSFVESLKDVGLPPETTLQQITAELEKERRALAGHLQRVKAIEREHNLRPSFVATVLKNVPPHLAGHVLEWGVANHARLPTKPKK